VEFDRAGRVDDKYAAQAERIRRKLDGSGVPFVGLSDPARPADERFGGLEVSGDAVTAVRIVYGEPVPDGPWATVDTSRRVGAPWEGSVPLRVMVERDMRLCGDRSAALDWTDDAATMIVDGRPVGARIVRAGGRWWAARCTCRDVEISVVARDWHPDTIVVDTVTDPLPMLSRSAARSRPARRPRPAPVPEGLSREPHRALVDAALRVAQRRAGSPAGVAPVPELPPYWSALWRAAVERQMDLAGEPEPAARLAVNGIVGQLTELDREAGWFREDSRLRERAIAETLLYGTGLSDRVASRPAQQAWRSRQLLAPPMERAEFDPRVIVDRQWIDAWTAWAGDRARA
jgi:hypothetical protein